MYTFFTASDFLPTKWSTADEKAQFGNTLLHFMLTGFLAGRFTEKLYTRLSMCYGHIAHFDRQGFSETWFDSPESIASFVNHLMQWPCHGDAGYTFSDVERAIQREAARLNLVAKVNEAAARSTQQRELALLDTLENKYRRDSVIPMPNPATQRTRRTRRATSAHRVSTARSPHGPSPLSLPRSIPHGIRRQEVGYPS